MTMQTSTPDDVYCAERRLLRQDMSTGPDLVLRASPAY